MYLTESAKKKEKGEKKQILQTKHFQIYQKYLSKIFMHGNSAIRYGKTNRIKKTDAEWIKDTEKEIRKKNRAT